MYEPGRAVMVMSALPARTLPGLYSGIQEIARRVEKLYTRAHELEDTTKHLFINNLTAALGHNSTNLCDTTHVQAVAPCRISLHIRLAYLVPASGYPDNRRKDGCWPDNCLLIYVRPKPRGVGLALSTPVIG